MQLWIEKRIYPTQQHKQKVYQFLRLIDSNQCVSRMFASEEGGGNGGGGVLLQSRLPGLYNTYILSIVFEGDFWNTQFRGKPLVESWYLKF